MSTEDDNTQNKIIVFSINFIVLFQLFYSVFNDEVRNDKDMLLVICKAKLFRIILATIYIFFIIHLYLLIYIKKEINLYNCIYF